MADQRHVGPARTQPGVRRSRLTGLVHAHPVTGPRAGAVDGRLPAVYVTKCAHASGVTANRGPARSSSRGRGPDARGERLPPGPGGTAVPDDDCESGRGLLIVEVLADRWGASPGPFPRKAVWAELDLVP
ncbi:ATP-binding protein [Streptomyces atratus]|uniref:hypothetical protein n=1 Tax=Streptomyces atratus TaxID=1893 RepID=UPI003650C5EC